MEPSRRAAAARAADLDNAPEGLPAAAMLAPDGFRRKFAMSPPPADDTGAYNDVFARLVEADEDIIGLLAYALYKQNKVDWLVSFKQAEGRAPDQAELKSYITGERTPRRLAIYRHLATATLEGKRPAAAPGAQAQDAEPAMPAVMNLPSPRAFAEPVRPASQAGKLFGVDLGMLGYIATIAGVIVGAWLLLRYAWGK